MYSGEPIMHRVLKPSCLIPNFTAPQQFQLMPVVALVAQVLKFPASHLALDNPAMKTFPRKKASMKEKNLADLQPGLAWLPWLLMTFDTKVWSVVLGIKACAKRLF